MIAAAAVVVAVESPALALFTRPDSVGANAFSTATLQSPTGLGVGISCAAGIRFRSAGKGSTDSGSVIVVNRPAGVATGDVMLAVLSWDGTASIAAPTGWTVIREDVQATLPKRQKLFYRVATAVEPATYTFTATGVAPADGVGVISAYSGVATASPVDVHGGQAQVNPPDPLITAPSVTPTASAGRMLVGFFSASSSGTITSAPGMAERAEIQEPDYALEVADEAIPPLVATGTRVAVQTGVDDLGIGQVVVLRAAGDPTLSSANLTWTATASPFASAYTLRRWNGAVLEQQQALSPRSTQSAVTGPLADGTSYRFELESVYRNWTSPPVDIVSTPACAQPGRPFACPADPNLRACVRFDEDVAGTYVDESSFANTVTHTNGTLVPGVSNAAAHSAPTARYEMADSASLNLTSAMTIEVWARLDSLPTSGRAGIIDNDGQYALILYPTEGLRCTNAIGQAPAVVVPTGVWFHAACVWNGTMMTVYIDGMPASATSLSGTMPTANTNPVGLLNTSPVFDEPMDGAVDNLRIWSSARTQAQICADAGLSGC